MRGRILRAPANNIPGLLIAKGQQYSFVLENVWRSASAPSADAMVDIELGVNGAVAAVTAVSESELAREHKEIVLMAAAEKGAAVTNALVTRLGASTLAALAVIALSWFFLTAISYSAGFLGKMEFTFWRVLGLINASSPIDSLRSLSGDGVSTGIYGVLGAAALVSPLLGCFWKDKRADLGGLLPLAFMVFIYLAVRKTLGNIGNSFGSAREIEAIRSEMMKGVSLGVGAYLAFAASIYLALKSATRFLTSFR